MSRIQPEWHLSSNTFLGPWRWCKLAVLEGTLLLPEEDRDENKTIGFLNLSHLFCCCKLILTNILTWNDKLEGTLIETQNCLTQKCNTFLYLNLEERNVP